MQGTVAQKMQNCLDCGFLKLVKEEEGNLFVLTTGWGGKQKRGTNHSEAVDATVQTPEISPNSPFATFLLT